MRFLVRERIRVLKQRRKKQWGYIPDETNLNVPTNELRDRIRQVLETLGIGDEYEIIRHRAENETDARKLNRTADEANEHSEIIEPPVKSRDDNAQRTKRRKKFSSLKVVTP